MDKIHELKDKARDPSAITVDDVQVIAKNATAIATKLDELHTAMDIVMKKRNELIDMPMN